MLSIETYLILHCTIDIIYLDKNVLGFSIMFVYRSLDTKKFENSRTLSFTF